uniref:Response regulator n=1 Tax=candidate division WOR-3 bacterium TaxID=2052148 RepID=A0A7V1EHC5_UNCW3
MFMKKILIVDDDLVVLHSLYLILIRDYRVEGLSDDKQALNRIRENSYDLIITDLFLNEITGLDLYWAAKDKEKVIIITAYPEKELALKAKSLLGDRFIPKSTPPEILKSKVASILEGKI